MNRFSIKSCAEVLEESFSNNFSADSQLSLFFKKQFAIEEKIQLLLRYLEDMVQLYQAAYESYLEGSIEDLNQGNEELGKIEKELDDLGRQIQMSLLHESLMPDSRDDLLWFLTKLDKVPSSFKHSLADIVLEKPEIPKPKKRIAKAVEKEKVITSANSSTRQTRTKTMNLNRSPP